MILFTHFRACFAFASALFALTTAALADDPPAATAPPPANAAYLDPKLPIDTRVADLLGRMTLDEKAMLLDHLGPDIPRFNIRSDGWNQSLHGIWWDRPTTMFPVPIAMAATWDTALIHDDATAISDEGRAIYNRWHLDPTLPGEKKGLIYRAPVINVSRNPYWGRIDECYGEDPYLTGRMGVAYIQGLQGNDPHYLKLAATLKHYAVNNVEKNRTSLSATVDERMLHEFWLPHFRDCVVEGGAQSVMASYNAINGVPLAVNKLMLTDILRGEWNFSGFVVSDLGGLAHYVTDHRKGQTAMEQAVADSLNAGCDFSDKEFRLNAAAAVRDGLVTPAKLDEACARVLRVRFHLGEFDPPASVPFSGIPVSAIGAPEHRALALRTAQELIVLLSNPTGLLPLDRTKIKSIAVIGPNAGTFIDGGYSGKPIEPVTPLQGIQNRALPGTQIVHVVGAEITPSATAFDAAAELAQSVDAARKADVAIVCVGTTLKVEAEGRDRTSLELPGNQEGLVEAVVAANPHTVVVEMNAGPLAVPWIKEHAPALVEAWWGGEEGGDALADVLFGSTEPSGRMPLTIYASADQVPPQDEYDVSKGFTYMYLRGAPLFAFGHGLSYTQFSYGPLSLSAPTAAGNSTVKASIAVTNTGKRPGDEVVQLYIHTQSSPVVQPKEKLAGFQRIHLAPGAKRTVTFILPTRLLAYYDVGTHRFVVNPGTYDVMAGAASDDIRSQKTLKLTTAASWAP